MKRSIIHIDQDLCNGCGQCASACHEGAIQIVDGKARLVSETYCDGLGACIGECPTKAITIVEREAESFDPAAVAQHLAHQAEPEQVWPGEDRLPCGCPGTHVRTLERPESVDECCCHEDHDEKPSQLGQWPVQLRLVPPDAPFLKGADVLICADCVPFALAGFHERYLAGHAVVVACPKLDSTDVNRSRIEALVHRSGARSLTVLRMEVPCCGGLAHMVREARDRLAPRLPLEIHIIGVGGEVQEVDPIPAAG